MRLFYWVKRLMKLVRWDLRRRQAAQRWGYQQLMSMPVVFGNALPKAGSHLIIQVLQGLTGIGPFVNPGFPPVNRFEDNSRLPEEVILANIERMRAGDIGYGYIHCQEPFVSALTSTNRATIFVYRDPRDMIVSHVFYATDIHLEHEMREFYKDVLSTNEERIDAEILGTHGPGFEYFGIRRRYEAYMGWFDQLEVLTLRFEDLIQDREASFARILDFLAGYGFTPSVSRQLAIEHLVKEIQPEKSGTFRKAQPGNWREHFTDTNIRNFKDHAGDLLIRLGYEQDNDW
jgi:hypothetical protein